MTHSQNVAVGYIKGLAPPQMGGVIETYNAAVDEWEMDARGFWLQLQVYFDADSLIKQWNVIKQQRDELDVALYQMGTGEKTPEECLQRISALSEAVSFLPCTPAPLLPCISMQRDLLLSSKPLYEAKVDALRVGIFPTNEELGAAAATEAAEVIQRAVRERGVANIILATGNSQLTFLQALRGDKTIAWQNVNVFHMDEYIGIAPNHPASFPLFLRKHLLSFVSVKAFYPVSGQSSNVEATCAEYARLLHEHPADLCACGYGENGHLAFNDPPFANFDDPVWVKVVKLAEASRRQQVGEGHFAKLQDVPTHAITLTIPALLAARRVLCIVPEARKADAVYRALRGPIGEDCPGSILRQASHAHLFLDKDSAAKI